MNVAFARVFDGKIKHGGAFQVEEHTKYFLRKGLKITGEKQADAVFAIDFYPKVIASALKSRILSKRFVVFAVGKLSEEQGWFRRLLISLFANKIHTLSVPLSQSFPFKSKVRYIRLGVDLTKFKPSRCRKDNKLLLSVGLYTPRKNYEQICQIAKRLPDFHFKIVGSVGDLQYYQRLQKVKPDNVQLMDTLPQDELIKLYQRAKLLIHPSRYEMFCGAILESIACETPVIANDLFNTRCNFGAVVAHASSTNEYVSKIRELVRNKSLYKEKLEWGLDMARCCPLEKMLESNYRAIMGYSCDDIYADLKGVYGLRRDSNCHSHTSLLNFLFVSYHKRIYFVK